MPKLKHTKVYRGGVSAQHLNIETIHATFNINVSRKAIDFRFNLASKGGGTTSVLLRIGIEDLSTVLEPVAEAFPDSVDVLSECAAIANKKILQQLRDARRVQKDEKERACQLVEKLEKVEEFVIEKYYDAPSENDEKEAKVKTELEDVINSLRALNSTD
jgi:hypothetical protein